MGISTHEKQKRRIAELEAENKKLTINIEEITIENKKEIGNILSKGQEKIDRLTGELEDSRIEENLKGDAILSLIRTNKAIVEATVITTDFIERWLRNGDHRARRFRD